MRKQMGILWTVVLVLSIGILTVNGQEKIEEIKEKRITVQMIRKPLFDVFMRLIYDYDVAIGFEESSLDRNHNDYHFETNIPDKDAARSTKDGRTKITFGGRPMVEKHLISLNHENARLEDVINDIVKQMQNYDWEINDGVINIFPAKDRNPSFKRLLKLKIREFVVWKGAEVGMIQPLIVLQLPELRKFLDDNNLLAESDRVAPWFIDRPLSHEMKFTNLTLQELLNAITQSKRGGWILRHKKSSNGCGKEPIELLI